MIAARALGFLAATFIAAGCAAERVEIADCPRMPVKGWSELLAKPPIARLEHRKDFKFDLLSETSQLLIGDSNYDYGILLTYVFSHPRLAREGHPVDERCVHDVSLMTRVPVEARGDEVIAAFVDFLRDKRVPADLILAVRSAREALPVFGTVGRIGEAEISAGVIESGARGRFFRIEVLAPKVKLEPRAAEKPRA